MSTLKADNLANLAGTQSTSMLNAINGSAKAWVNFNGSGVVGIRAAYNVSSITDNGVGLWTINLTVPFADTNYVTFVNGNVGTTAAWDTFVVNASKTTGGFQCGCNYTSAGFDSPYMTAAAFR